MSGLYEEVLSAGGGGLVAARPPRPSASVVLWRRSGHTMADLPNRPVMKRWWAHMADIMETKPDNEPVAVPLEIVFHMR